MPRYDTPLRARTQPLILQHTSSGGDRGTEFPFSDPWEELGEDVGRRESWLLNYIDILTLFLALMVVLLVLRPSNAPTPVEADPETNRFDSVQPIENPVSYPTIFDLAEQHPLDHATAVLTEQKQEITQDKTGADRVVYPLLPEDTVLGQSDHLTTNQSKIEQPSSVPTDLPPATPEPLTAETNGQIHVTELPEEQIETANTPSHQHQDPGQRFMDRLAEIHLDQRLEVTQVMEGVHLEVRDNILFAQGSAELKTEGEKLLDELAQILLDQDGIISVEGHTDNRPISSHRFPSNWELSSGRASTVTRYLIVKGLDPVRLRAVGHGDTRPLQSNETPEGRARNRRVALIVALSEDR